MSGDGGANWIICAIDRTSGGDGAIDGGKVLTWLGR